MPVQITKRPPRKGSLLQTIKQEQSKALRDVGRFVRAKAAKYPTQNPDSTYRRTGTLGRSIAVSDVQSSGKGLYVDVGTNKHYARYVNDGTGIYGPKHQKIVPKTAKALAWRAQAGRLSGVRGGKKGPGALNVGMSLVAAGIGRRKQKSGTYKIGRRAAKDIYMLFARSVRGMQPWHFMEKAFKDPETLAYFKARAERMYADIKAALIA